MTQKITKAANQIKNNKNIFRAEKINRLARYISHITGINMVMATRLATIQIDGWKGC